MKKARILFACLVLITSMSMAQQGLDSKDGTLFNPSVSALDLYKGISFSPGLSFGSILNHTDLPMDKSLGFANLGLNNKPKANSGDDNPVFPMGCILANLGIGVGDLFWGGGYGTVLGVSPTLDVDVAITEKLGIGNIGVGGTIAYTSTTWTYSDGSYSDVKKFSAILAGLRASYHFMFNTGSLNDKLDPYAGILLGFIIADNPGGLGNNSSYLVPKANVFQPGVFAGAHYYFVPHFGVFAELGYNGFSIFTFGITLKTK